jgi:hypothetical protein
MSKFDEYIHNILEETYFGGSPYERTTRIKRHITFEENEDPFDSDSFDDESDSDIEDVIRNTRSAQDKQMDDLFGRKKKESIEDKDIDREASVKGQIREVINDDDFLSKIHVEEGENRTSTAGAESEEHIYDKFKDVDLERVSDERTNGFWSADRIGTPVYELKEDDKDKLPKVSLTDGREVSFTILAFPYKYIDPEDELRLFDDAGDDMSDKLAMWQILAVHPEVSGDVYTAMRPIYVGPSTSFKKFHELMNLD